MCAILTYYRFSGSRRSSAAAGDGPWDGKFPEKASRENPPELGAAGGEIFASQLCDKGRKKWNLIINTLKKVVPPPSPPSVRSFASLHKLEKCELPLTRYNIYSIEVQEYPGSRFS